MLDKARSALSRKRHSKTQLDWPRFQGSDVDRLRANEPLCSWPGTYYGKTLVLAKAINARYIVEVGVAFGYHAQYLLGAIPDLRYVGIDPYLPGYDSNDPFVKDVSQIFNTNPKEAMDRLHNAVERRLTEQFGKRFELWRETSHEASRRVPNESVDFVFIDGDHRHEAVLQDLTDWWPKVRGGGLLVGDDFMWPGVQSAVEEFFGKSQTHVVLATEPRTSHLTFFALQDEVRQSSESDRTVERR